ncbi:nicotinamide riboside transporter PnuC [Companilactobacillus zhongbaensis]|uniref:nicotinamide riboside transporter PnuC n=1 Tax=Companilactobacillus zhongbaensis TaxID=2486009 RepID=UPI000F794686|nr:nicotinamide riboside transporter PnuC [Companilactobacillus zhongbaensis]
MMVINDFKGWSKSSYGLLALGIVMQLIILISSGNYSAMNLVTVLGAMLGVTCVLMISNRKASNGIFGIISAIIIIVNAMINKVYADALLQFAYIFVLDIPVLVAWTKHEDGTGNAEVSKPLQGFKQWAYAIVGMLAIWAVSYVLLKQFGDTQPVVDALGFSIGMIASILCVKRIKTQFIFWFVQGIVSMVLWIRASMLAGTGLLSPLGFMYVIYMLNDLVGWMTWSRAERKEKVMETAE